MNKETEPRRKCEAPIHSEDCSGYGTEKDHFTPQQIAKLLNWTKEQANSEENIQYLSPACHDEKDRSTPARLELARRQLRGEYIKLGDHQIVDDPNYVPRQESNSSLRWKTNPDKEKKEKKRKEKRKKVHRERGKIHQRSNR